jgi:hypothetical protein
LEGRIERCPSDTNLATWLLPSAKGWKRSIQQSTTKLQGNPIVASSSPNGSLDSLNSVAKIYPSASDAAKELDISESIVSQGCNVNGVYLYLLADLPLKLPREPPSIFCHVKSIPISIFTIE